MKKFSFSNLILSIIFIIMAFEIIFLSIQNKKLNDQLSKLIGHTSAQPDMVVGTKLADSLSVSLEYGNVVNFDEKHPKYLVIYFSTTCKACIEDAETWMDLYEYLGKKNISMFGICQGEPDIVNEFIIKNKLKFPVAPDPTNVLLKKFGIHSLPSKSMIDEDNIVLFYSRGASGERDLKELKKIVPELQAG